MAAAVKNKVTLHVEWRGVSFYPPRKRIKSIDLVFHDGTKICNVPIPHETSPKRSYKLLFTSKSGFHTISSPEIGLTPEEVSNELTIEATVVQQNPCAERWYLMFKQPEKIDSGAVYNLIITSGRHSDPTYHDHALSAELVIEKKAEEDKNIKKERRKPIVPMILV